MALLHIELQRKILPGERHKIVDVAWVRTPLVWNTIDFIYPADEFLQLKHANKSLVYGGSKSLSGSLAELNRTYVHCVW
jgi:hypothetical protein